MLPLERVVKLHIMTAEQRMIQPNMIVGISRRNHSVRVVYRHNKHSYGNIDSGVGIEIAYAMPADMKTSSHLIDYDKWPTVKYHSGVLIIYWDKKSRRRVPFHFGMEMSITILEIYSDLKKSREGLLFP